MEKRLPKSPLPSPRSPALYESYKSGCAWSLIHFFDFRQSHSSGKLISDKKHVKKKQIIDYENKRNRLTLLNNAEKPQESVGGVDHKNVVVNPRRSVLKKIVEEEMSIEHQRKNIATAKVQDVLSESELVGDSPKKYQNSSKNFKKSQSMPVDGCNDAASKGNRQSSNQNVAENSLNGLIPAQATEAKEHPKNGKNHSRRKNIGGMKNDQLTEISLQVHMDEAVEEFINKKLIDGTKLSRGGASNQSKNFIEALEILNSNKELFIKLLQDPNSLLVKHIQELRDSQSGKQQTQSFSDDKLSEHQDKCLHKASKDSQSSDTIVVLKPNATSLQNVANSSNHCSSQHSHYSSRNKGESDQPAFFSFEHMKRKLRHAMKVSRKEQNKTSLEGVLQKYLSDFQDSEEGAKEISRHNIRNPPKTYLDIGGMSRSSGDVKGGDKVGQVRNVESGNGRNAVSTSGSDHKSSSSVSRHSKGNESNINFPPRKHLFEMLNGRNDAFFRKETPKTVGRISSFPEYDFLPALSPGKEWGYDYYSAHMRFLPYCNYPNFNGDRWRVHREKNRYSGSLRKKAEAPPQANSKKPDDQLQMVDAKPSIYSNTSSVADVVESIYLHGDDWSHRAKQTSSSSGKVLERYSTVDQGESSIVEVPFEPDVDTCPESQTLSSSINGHSSFPLIMQRAKQCDGMTDEAEQPSHVPVHEPFVVEDITSPLSTVCQPGTPLDLKSTFQDEHGSLSESIKAVLQVSCPDWEKLSMKYHLSDQIIDPSLFDNMEAWPDKSFGDPRLIISYIDEVLSEVHQCYSECSPWILVLKPRPQPVLLSRNMVHEVLKHVDWQLLSQLPQETLQQLVEKDLAKSGTWMDSGIDAEDVVTEMVDDFLEDLIVETAIGLQTFFLANLK
ncbi:hypothetical protein SLEP1_g8640 [Rubroshorea leprosula]|uniref:DUF4378 domain-containing protein n=1 Tax=Rubroshorea leprosula TaxID=152421 RepID=A0AAV5IDG1_9ROSI|nr:hypothetical protein SLEP1_g8640 [Rubroshorea leprosula]